MLNKLIASMLPLMPKRFIWLFSKRYIAGTSISDAIQISQQLNEQGIMVTIDILGEFIHTLNEAKANSEAYQNLLQVIKSEKINGNCSVKPTMFGLLLDKNECYLHLRGIVQKAAELNNFIRIDMEDSSCTNDTIELYRKLKSEFPDHVGIVVQSYLRRTLSDIDLLLDINSGAHPLNFRLCKGIYVEPATIAFKMHDEINSHYLEDLEVMIKNGIYVAIATHDYYLIENALKLIDKYQLKPDQYEFQMLYGVTPELRKSIIEKGHRMRVYVPFGEHWFGYSTRRLKENPKIAGLIIKSLIFRG